MYSGGLDSWNSRLLYSSIVVLCSGKREKLKKRKVYSVIIGTTEWLECKEKAMGIVADWLWVLAIIIGKITGVI